MEQPGVIYDSLNHVWKLLYTNLHASGSVTQTSICPHLDRSVALLLCQLQHSCMVRYGLVEVPLRVVGTAQVAVGSRLLTPVLQSLPKTSFNRHSEATAVAISLHVV